VFLRSSPFQAAETGAHLVTKHPDYGKLSARIAVSNLHKNTRKSFRYVECNTFASCDHFVLRVIISCCV
jgi:hypothetical protein